MPPVEQWARTRVRTCRELRRGAWYRVLRATPLEGTLEVCRHHVTVPRTFLQILPFRPQLWSVVPRLPSAPHPPLAWGSSYGVCPSCCARASLGQHALKLCCPRCNSTFPVAWEDSGLRAFEGRRPGTSRDLGASMSEA